MMAEGSRDKAPAGRLYTRWRLKGTTVGHRGKAAELVHRVFGRGGVARVWMGRRRRHRVGKGSLPIVFDMDPPGKTVQWMSTQKAKFLSDHRQQGTWAQATWSVTPGVYLRRGGTTREWAVQAHHRARLMSWNCNGLGSVGAAGKRQAFARLVSREQLPAVVGLQETLLGVGDHQVVVPGYYSFSSPMDDGLPACRGMSLLVKQGLHVRELDTGDTNIQAIWAGKGVLVDAPCVVANVYTPTKGKGASATKEARRLAVIKQLGSLVREWHTHYGEGVAIVVMGDLNAPNRQDLEYLLARGDVMLHPGPLQMTIVENENKTRTTKYKEGVKETTLDHFLVNNVAKKLFNKHVDALWTRHKELQSDHVPIVIGFRGLKACMRGTRSDKVAGPEGEAAQRDEERDGAGGGAAEGAPCTVVGEATAPRLVDVHLVAERAQYIVQDPGWARATVALKRARAGWDSRGGSSTQARWGAGTPVSGLNPPEIFYRTAMRVLQRHGCLGGPHRRRTPGKRPAQEKTAGRGGERTCGPLEVTSAEEQQAQQQGEQKRKRRRINGKRRSRKRRNRRQEDQDAQDAQDATGGRRTQRKKRGPLELANAVRKRIRLSCSIRGKHRHKNKNKNKKKQEQEPEDAQALDEVSTKVKELKTKAKQRSWASATSAAIEAAQRGDWEQVWKYIKEKTKKHVGRATEVPMRDPSTGHLMYDEESKRGIILTHFAKLAEDPDLKPVEWWHTTHPLPLEPECEEVNAEVSWTEVYAALEQAGTSKAPGLDGLPNEVLRVCRGPPTALEAPNPMAEALLEQCRAMLEGQVSPEINTSVLVPVDKPGKDAQEVDNRRGISLMSTLLKLVTKIASNRIQEHVPAVSKEQAGFRPGEECIQNVAALHDVCHLRRHHWSQPTYVAFMDLKKAFDTVPHAAMLHVLHAKGVRGKIYRFIEKVYQTGTFVIQSKHPTTTTTTPAPIQRGVRQGDTLSPLLFSLFIDHALKDLPGVPVPDKVGESMGSMRGLLVADDAVLLASSAQDIQAALKKLQKWCDTYHMQVGHDKCGLMVPLPEFRHLHQQAKEASEQFVCQKRPIPVVDQYTYLGLCIDTHLDITTMRQGREEAGEQALRAMTPLLAHTRVPLALKALCIKGMLLPTLTYGAEIWGIQPHGTVLANIYSDAMQLAMVSSRKSKATYRREFAVMELGLPSLQASIITSTIRAVMQWTHAKTWIHDLLHHHLHRALLEEATEHLHAPPAPQTPEADAEFQCWLQQLQHHEDPNKCKTIWMYQASITALKALASTHKTVAQYQHQTFYGLQELSSPTFSNPKQLTKHIRKVDRIQKVIETAANMTRKKTNKPPVVVTYPYHLTTADKLLQRGLHTGDSAGLFITPLVRARLNGYGNLMYRQSNFSAQAKAAKRAHNISDKDYYCCSCKQQVKDDLHHLGLHCKAYTDLRQRYLDQITTNISTYLKDTKIVYTSEDLWTICLGGTGLFVDMHPETNTLTKLTKYWLHAEPLSTPPPSPTTEKPPFIQISAFLKRVMRKHTRAIDIFLGRQERGKAQKQPPSSQEQSQQAPREGTSHAAGTEHQKPRPPLKQSKLTFLWRER